MSKVNISVKEANNRFQSLIDSSSNELAAASKMGVVTVSKMGVVTFCNSVFLKLTGYSKNEIIGKHISKLPTMQRKNVPKYLKLIASLFKGVNSKEFEVEYITKSKEIRFGKASVCSVKEDGTATEIMLILRDITDRKNAEEGLNKSEESYRMLFKNMIDGFALHEIVSDKKGRPIDYVFLEVNSRYEKLTGLKRKNIIGKKATSVIPGIEKDPGNWISKYGKVALTGKKIRFEQYSENLDKWFSVLAFKYKKNQFAVIFEDITESKRMQKEAANTRLYLDRSLASSPIGIFVLDKQGVFKYINSKCLKIIGYKQKDILGKTFQEVLPKITSPRSAKTLTEKGKRRLQTGAEIIGTEIELLNKKGKKVQIYYSASGIKDDRGNIIGSVAFASDITKIKEAEINTYEEKKKFQKYLDVTGVIILVIGANQKVNLINNKGCEVLGYKKNEIEGKNWFDNFLPEDVKRDVKKVFNRLMSGEKNLGKFYENPILTKNGIEKIIVWNSTMLKDEKGNIIGSISSGEDMTDKIRGQKKLNEKSNQLKILMENTPDWIFIKNRKSEFILNNKTHKELLGVLPEDDIVGKTDFDFFTKSAAQKHFDLEQSTMNTGKAFINFEELMYSKTHKNKIWVSNSKVPLRDEKGKINGIVGIARDITERKEAEKKLKVSYKKLQKTLNDVIRTLASIVETKDPYTSGHQKRVAQLAIRISEIIGLTKEKIEAIKTAALLHDIGKMNIPTSILARPGKLSNIEYTMIKAHPQLGYDVLKNIEFPWSVADIVLQHHEKEDGSGYPNGLRGKDILIEAKILLVADVVEAMSSHRPYRPALGINKAIMEIKKNKGKLYDPEIVDVCVKLFKEKKFKFKN
jgi:PAS domain S-box-containing protein/putative nucleotidyltransferase with HDIG domain